MIKNRFKFERLVSKDKPKDKPKETLDQAKYRQANRYWLRRSSRIALELIRRRDKMGADTEYLVQWCVFPEGRVQEILSGKADIRLSELITISDALGLDVDISFSESYK